MVIRIDLIKATELQSLQQKTYDNINRYVNQGQQFSPCLTITHKVSNLQKLMCQKFLFKNPGGRRVTNDVP